MPKEEKYESHQAPAAPRRGPGGGGRMGSGEKAKDFGKAIRQLIGYCRKYIPAILAAMFFAVAGSVLNLIGPRQAGRYGRTDYAGAYDRN